MNIKHRIDMKKKIDVKYLGVPNICFSITDKDDKREAKFKKQRIKRGFDDSETWNLDNTIVNFVLPRLKVFEETTVGCPYSLTDKKWHNKLKKMIRAFELLADDDRCYEDKEYKEINTGLKLFCRWFTALWN
jgi:hypothetical protein